MIPSLPANTTANLSAVVYDLSELDVLGVAEASFPEPSRVLLQVDLDPTVDIDTIAADLNIELLAQGVETWPEYQGQIVFAEGNTLYFVWMKAIGWMFAIIGALIVLPILFPVILYFVSESFRTTINSIMSLVMIVILMLIMSKMMKSMTPAKVGAGVPKRELPSWSERVMTKVDNMATRVGGVVSSYRGGKKVAAGKTSGILSGIGDIVGSIRRAPKTAMSSYEKGQATERVADLTSQLERYREELTPSQRAKLDREQEIIEESRREYA